MDTFRNVSDHAVTLASGQPLAPGEAAESDMKDPHDKTLRNEGLLTKADDDKEKKA